MLLKHKSIIGIHLGSVRISSWKEISSVSDNFRYPHWVPQNATITRSVGYLKVLGGQTWGAPHKQTIESTNPGKPWLFLMCSWETAVYNKSDAPNTFLWTQVTKLPQADTKKHLAFFSGAHNSSYRQIPNCAISVKIRLLFPFRKSSLTKINVLI